MNEDKPGPGVDAQGRPTIDPSTNVKALTEAAVQRLDDLRNMETRHREEISGLVAGHLAATASLRADYDAQLREAESKRIDAIRAVDVGAVQRAAEVSAAQAQTLATQVTVSAEALRAQVAAAQSAAATSLAAALDPLITSIADLRRAQYEQAGQKAQVVEGRATSAATVAIVGIGVSILLLLIAVAGLIIAKG